MQETKTIVDEVRAYVVHVISTDLPDEITYHSIGHTIDVVTSCLEIANEQNIPEEEIEILEIAAWFHDIGYTDDMTNHEERSAERANKFLSERGHPREKIDAIIGCILATKMPQEPQNRLEQIICDADMMHLAKGDYFKKADLLHKEIVVTKSCDISEKEWLKMNEDFLDQHCFFTDYARKRYESAVKENLKKVKNRLQKWTKATK